MSQTILITGATDGIGLQLARLYKLRGNRVLLLGRRSWGELAHVATEFDVDDYCQTDLSRPGYVDAVLQFLQQREISQLDLVIHNAGTGYYGSYASQTSASIDEVINVNLVAPIALTHALRPLLADGSSQVTFISSIASMLPAPEFCVYAATKSALEEFSRNLATEWGGRVVVQCLRPGATLTGLHPKLGIPVAKMNWKRFAPAADVAVGIVKAIDSQQPLRTLGVQNQLMGFFGRHFNGVVDEIMLRRQRFDIEQREASNAQVCLITGAANGIGKALAQRFAAAGYHVIGVDVDEQGAALVRGERISFVIGNLGGEPGVQKVLASIHHTVDLVIHSAGISAVGHFDKLPQTHQRKVIDINLRAPLLLTAGLFQRGLVRPDCSHIFISSLSRSTGYPGASVYAATKAGLADYARSLRVALAGEQSVMTVYPGPTQTGHARRYSPDNSRESKRMPPVQLAQLIYEAYERKQTTLIPGLSNKVLVVLCRLAPWLSQRIMKRTMFDRLDDRILVD